MLSGNEVFRSLHNNITSFNLSWNINYNYFDNTKELKVLYKQSIGY